MANDDPGAQLDRLRRTLAGLEDLDSDARVLARGVLAELARLGVTAEPAAPTPHGLEALAVRFEADHPSMAAALRQVSSLLANAGI
jgi:hypothetical protein